MYFGSCIKSLRKEKGLTQKELSSMANIGLASLQRYESNERIPNMKTLENILDALEITIGKFMIKQRFLYDFSETGSMIRDMRKKKNMTREKLSEITGIPVENIKAFEVGIYPVDLKDQEALYKAFGIKTHVIEDKDLDKYKNIEIELKENLHDHFNRLNQKGKEKAIESVELLTKIPEYKKAP